MPGMPGRERIALRICRYRWMAQTMEQDHECMPPRIVHEPLAHFDYDDISDCGCSLCSDYRRLMKAYHATLKYTVGHKKRCRCAPCLEMKHARMLFVAASNKRDVYSEFSFMMRASPSGLRFMEWLMGFIETYNQSPGWWYSRSPDVPRRFWILRFNRWLTEKPSE